MSYAESKLPRFLAAVLLIVSVLMFIALINIALILAKGGNVPIRSWMFPMTILATGAVLTWLLTRRQLAMQLYMAAFALWLVTTGYYLLHYKAMLP
jgi:hypothetical protein